MAIQPLSNIPAGTRIRLVSIPGGRQLNRRLLALGLTVGTEMDVLHRRGRGVVVARNGNRVAIGSGIAEKLGVKVVD
jgi:ferrous iron transport protein A